MRKLGAIFIAVVAGVGCNSPSSEVAPVPVKEPVINVPLTGCSRFTPGSVITQPEALFSQNGLLQLGLSYRTSVDAGGGQLFCYVLPDGSQSPTLHLKPGDHLQITLTNDTPTVASADSMQMQLSPNQACADSSMTGTSTNIHFHGANVSPVCHQDDVLRTYVNSGNSFTYDVQFPKNEPPGLYWYHPHVHGLSETAVLGGASGAIVVDGIESVQPEVAGLPEQILILRDNLVPGAPTPGGAVPSWDLSLNYVPVPYPNYKPARIQMKNGEKQFWRVVNAGADSILDLQLNYDGVAQPLRIEALDGVPTSFPVNQSHVLLGPGARAEFIAVGPAPSVHEAKLITLKVDTGPDGDNDPTRPIAMITPSVISAGEISTTLRTVPTFSPSRHLRANRFKDLDLESPVRTRQIFFSEDNPSSRFFITEVGATPKLFDFKSGPAITVTQGTTEDWIVSNQSQENHYFHIHQIHFLLLEENGVPVPRERQQYLDTVQIPYWSGSGPYPSVKIRLDFRGADLGDLVYHCHILEHEDQGMMAILRVLPR